jgi:hypothetical protein
MCDFDHSANSKSCPQDNKITEESLLELFIDQAISIKECALNLADKAVK